MNNWRNFPVHQQPIYEDEVALKQIESQLAKLSPIVTSEEIDSLTHKLENVQHKRAIIIHGGDCVETFSSINESALSAYSKLMLDMARTIKALLNRDVIMIGRVAGQFAKPRSHPTESRGDVELPIYRGDIINSIELSSESRKADPKRLLDGYYHSLKARKYLKKLDPQHYISHEGLLLNYEECFTRKQLGKYYNLSTHFLWIGNRTRSLQGAHIEYARGITNPIGVKLDGSIQENELINLIEVLNPQHKPGRLILIFRIGLHKIQSKLPKLIRAIKQYEESIIVMCDPMHGNTILESGKKTRNINTILLELKYCMDTLKAEKIHFGGIHLEMTNQKIRECGDEGESIQIYNSYCDPRLNYEQSIRIANFIADELA